LKRIISIFLGSATIAFVTLVVAHTVSRFKIETEIVECEIISWHHDVWIVSEKIRSLEHSLGSPHLSARERARIHGLMGDLAMASENKRDAAAHYAEELLGLVRFSDPGLYERLKNDPTGLNAVIVPAKPPAGLPSPLPFDASELTRHSPPEIPWENNAHEMLFKLPEILHGDELRKIASAGPADFHKHADRAAVLLEENEAALAAYGSLGDRYRLYRRPVNEKFVPFDVASGLFMVRLLLSWHFQDRPGVVENHKRVLQMCALAASDGGLAPVMAYLGNRRLLEKHVRALLHEGLGDQTTTAALLSNLHEYPLDRSCLHPVAAREYLSVHAHIINDLDSILVPGEGLATVENFREHWIRYFEEDLYLQMSRLHACLTDPDGSTDFPRVQIEDLFAEAVHAMRPCLYHRYAHAGMSEIEANLIRTHAVCRLSAKTMSGVAFPDGKRIHAALHDLEENESSLLNALETHLASATSQEPKSERLP